MSVGEIYTRVRVGAYFFQYVGAAVRKQNRCRALGTYRRHQYGQDSGEYGNERGADKRHIWENYDNDPKRSYIIVVV